MNTIWNLNIIYQGLLDPAYERDITLLKETITETEQYFQQWKAASTVDLTEKQLETQPQFQKTEKEWVESILLQMEKIYDLFAKLFGYVNLSQSADTENGDFMAQSAKLQKLYAAFSPLEVSIKKMLADISSLDSLIQESTLIKEYEFLLSEICDNAKHLLTEDAEEMYAAMNMIAGDQWSNLQSYLTSTVKVSYRGDTITLPEVRNLAYNPHTDIRKDAYDAELASYEQIQDATAFALNNIKNQASMMAEKRCYDSVLHMTLKQSRMSKKTLDVMMDTIQEYAPVLRKYLRKKASMLGYEGGLPWYELFAPVGKNTTVFTPEQAKDILISCFSSFSKDLSLMTEEAFEEEWIDFYPRKGKRGGAFCYHVPHLKQSRILTNFDGSFNSVGTLAHELGHAYHNRQIEDQRSLNNEYPMPVAETASTFQEILFGTFMMNQATGEEKLFILENNLRDHTQVILDIYSRYLFETAVLEQSKEQFLMAKDLNELMIDAQKKAYGDGLDPSILNAGMWINKSHYYNADFNFYNFPYAFGNLFALGLYGLWQKEGEAFVPKYHALLNATVSNSVEDIGNMAGIDMTQPDFWKAGMEQISALVEEFLTF